MKHTRLFNILSMLALFIIAGCNSKDDGMDTDPEGQAPILEREAEIRTITQTDIILHDLEALVLNQLYFIENNDPGSPKPESHLTDQNDFDGFGSCAIIELDADNNKLTLDFNTGCTDVYGITRSGQLIINYTSPTNPIGNEINYTAIDLTFSKLKING